MATTGNPEENLSLKAAIPQIYASFAASSIHLVMGIAFAYSAILIPQLKDEETTEENESSVIVLDKEKASWVASSPALATIPAGLIAAVLIDCMGRLNLCKFGAIPMLIGWVLIALSKNYITLIIGRVLTGIPQPWGTSAAASYIAEISTPRLRGSLTSMNSLCISFGLIIGYIMGALWHWRIVAWISVGFSIFPFILVLTIPESYSYLLLKDREDAARRSIQWLNRSQSAEFIDKLFNATRNGVIAHKQAEEATGQHGCKRAILKFKSPACYKPMLIVIGVFFFQNFTGIFITMYYSVNFMKDIGTDLNPYVASIFVGGARCVGSVANIWLLKIFKRRHLLLFSTCGMAICMFISGTFTNLVHQGATEYSWIPMAAVVGYMQFSMVGLLPLPFIFAAELYPLEIRGVIQSVTLSLSYTTMFAALKLYYSMIAFFGGIAGLQFYFAGMSLIAFVFTLLVVPESHKKTLQEVEEYFMSNTLYLSLKCRKNNEQT